MATTLHAHPQPDPIHAAISRHRAAWSEFQSAPEGEPSLQAEDECDASRAALLGTPCATRFGALALLDHLRWWLAEEGPNAEGYGDTWNVARSRASDLVLFLGEPVERSPVALGEILATFLPAPGRTACSPPTAHVRAARLLTLSGEILAGFLIIGGGSVLTGLATLL